MSTSNAAAKSQDPMADVRKVGYLKKLKSLKKVKKKYFVLRDESVTGPARLEYFDTEKKFSNGVLPKRSIVLKTCFSISKKSDSKHKFGIAMYTKEDCFTIVCDAEVEQNEWLTVMMDLQNEAFEDGQIPRPLFEHIWQVTLKPRGLCNNKTLMSGLYRLCLTNRTLSLIRPNHLEPDIVFELQSIRRYGHSDCFFFMEVGRSAMTGAGELWMEVEDTVISQNIHEAFISSMKNSSSEPPPTTFRPRSHSSISNRAGSKSVNIPANRGASPAFDSATLPKRSMSTSGERPASPRLRLQSKTSKGSLSSGYGRGHSPLATSPLSYSLHDEGRMRADSIDSRGTPSSLSADEQDLSPLDHQPSSGAGSTRSGTPDGQTLGEQDYLSMAPSAAKREIHNQILEEHVAPSTQAGLPPTPYITVSSDDGFDTVPEGYMEMAPTNDRQSGSVITPTSSSSVEPYTDMSPSTPQADFMYSRDGMYESRNSYSSSPAVSTCSAHEDGYLEMGPISHALPTVKEQVRMNDGGYLDMSPGSSTTSGSLTQLKPERMQSYIFDDTEPFQKRAYSVGSNPVKPKQVEQGYMDMTGGKSSLNRNSKSSSAPHLGDDQLAARAGTANMNDLFMELDFYPSEKWKESFRPRTGSGGSQDMGRPRTSSGGTADMMRPRTSSGGRADLMRPRTSSFGHTDIRKRTSSFGREGPSIHRTASMNRHTEAHRPRTSTICQDSFRSRTSSFGTCTGEMRPRSSSYGNQQARYRKQRTLLQESLSGRQSSRHSSQESLKRSSTTSRTSQESLKSSTSMEYMDMQGGTATAANTASKLSSSPSHTSNVLPYQRKMSIEKRTSPSPLAAKSEENYMAMDFGDKGGSVSHGRRPSSGSSPNVESRKRIALEKINKNSEQQKVAPAVATTSTSSKSRLKQLGNKLNPKYHLKMPQTNENMKSSSESLSSGHSSDTRGKEESNVSADAAQAVGERSNSKDVTIPHTPGEYIDISFNQKPPKLPNHSTTSAAKARKSSEQNSSPVMYRREHEYEELSGESYSMMSPSDTASSGSGGASQLSSSLHKVACPLSLEDTSPLGDSSGTSVDSHKLHSSGQVQSEVVVLPYSHSSSKSVPSSACTTEGKSSDDSDYFNLDLTPVNKKRDSPSQSKGNKQKIISGSFDQSTSGSARHSSSPIASLFQGLATGRKSPKSYKEKSESSPKREPSDYSEMSVCPTSSPKDIRRRRRSDSSSPNPSSSQFTRTVQNTTVVKPNAVHGVSIDTPTTETSAIRSIKSTGSLTAMDQITASKVAAVSPKIVPTSTELISELSTHAAASGMLQEGAKQDRLSQDMTVYENMTFEKPSRQTSHSSAGSCDTELHYAALDLSAGPDDPSMGGLESQSPMIKSRHTSGSTSGALGNSNGTGNVMGACIEEEAPLQYAQIDFVKSESLKASSVQQASGGAKETQLPFEVASVQALHAVPNASDNTKTTQPPFDLG